jgi:hypothetical protein
MKKALKTVGLAFAVAAVVGVGFQAGTNASNVATQYVIWKLL